MPLYEDSNALVNRLDEDGVAWKDSESPLHVFLRSCPECGANNIAALTGVLHYPIELEDSDGNMISYDFLAKCAICGAEVAVANTEVLEAQRAINAKVLRVSAGR